MNQNEASSTTEAATVHLPHMVGIGLYANGDLWRAACSCGWRMLTNNKGDALRYATMHLEGKKQ